MVRKEDYHVTTTYWPSKQAFYAGDQSNRDMKHASDLKPIATLKAKGDKKNLLLTTLQCLH